MVPKPLLAAPIKTQCDVKIAGRMVAEIAIVSFGAFLS